MTDSASSMVAIFFGLGIFAVIVAVGWRSVQNRRILRMHGNDGQETIIVAGESDKITSVATTVETVETMPDAVSAKPADNPAIDQAQADAAGQDRLDRVVSSTK